MHDIELRPPSRRCLTISLGLLRLQLQLRGTLADCFWTEGAMGFNPFKVVENAVGSGVHAVGNAAKDAGKEFEGALKKAADTAKHMSPSELGHTALDVASFVPGLGTVTGLANAGWYAAEGDWKNAAFSAATAIPVAGDFVDVAKVGKDVVTVGKDVETAVKLSEDAATAAKVAEDGTKVAKDGKELAKVGGEGAKPGVQAYPDGSFRTPDGKFASISGERSPGTASASRFADFLSSHGVDVVGQELEVNGPLGVRRYDIVTRNSDGTLHGIEIKSGGASRSRYQDFSDMFINRYGATGRGRISGQSVTGTSVVFLPGGY
jgi:hypothetical protein